jgi:4-hydroxy-tetrahydrodipicolinate synthase
VTGSPPYSIVVALLTPYTARGTVDLGALRSHVDVLVDEGIDAVMPCGTTGEGPALSDRELDEVTAAVVEAAAGRVLVMAHVGRPTTGATVALARSAQERGAWAVSAVTPYYYRMEDDQLRAHYRSLLRAVPELPVFAYNIPDRTGNDLRPDVARSLAEEGLAGIKDSTKSFPRHLEYLAIAADHGFSVFMGSDELALEAMRHGSAGSVSAVGNFAPHLLVRLRRACLEGRDSDAQALQKELAELRRRVTAGPALRGIKRATSRFLRDRGVRYRAALRPPL